MRKSITLLTVALLINLTLFSANELLISEKLELSNNICEIEGSMQINAEKEVVVVMAACFKKTQTKSLIILNVFQYDKTIDIFFYYPDAFSVEISNLITGEVLVQNDYERVSNLALNIEHLQEGDYTIKVIISSGYYIGNFKVQGC